MCICNIYKGKFNKLPFYQQDNEFILNYYRTDLTIKSTFKSLFCIHNETGNIYSHLLGFILFITLFSLNPIQNNNQIVNSIYYVSVCSCFLFSALFHLFMNTSEYLFNLFSKLDYFGINFIIFGSFIGLVNNFHNSEIYLIIISILFILNTLFIVFTNSKSMNNSKVRTVRAILFTFYGLLILVPIIQYTQISVVKNISFLKFIILELFTLVGGAIIFATRVPECYFPGKFDLLFSSHQIFHVCVIIGNIFHYLAIKAIV